MKRYKALFCLIPALLLASLALTPETARGDDRIFEIQLGAYDEGAAVNVDNVIVTGVGFWGFFVQEPAPDGEYGWQYSGIWVFSNNSHLGDVKRGDEVNLDGTYEEYFELSEIDIADGSYEIVSRENPIPDPVHLAITDINDQGPLAEIYEGVFVKVDITDETLYAGPEDENEEWLLWSDWPPDTLNDVYIVMDHVSADPEGDFEYETPPEGSLLTFAQGPLNYSYGSYKIAPRSCEEDLGGPCIPSLSGAYAVTPGTFGMTGEGAVNVQFSVAVDEATSEDPENYEFTGPTTIVSLHRDDDNHKIVHIITGPQSPGAETIQVSGVKSEAGGLTMEGTQQYTFRNGITPIAMIQTVPGPPYLPDASILLDQVVTIQGRVTAMDGNYYYLQEGSGGPWNEIYSRLSKIGDLAIGDSVEVSGEVREYQNASTQLGFRVGVNHFFNLGPASQPVTHTDVTADQIIYNSRDGNNEAEPFESILLKLSSAVVDSSADTTTVFGEWFLIQMPDTAACDLNELGGSPVYYQPCVGDLVDMTGVLRYEFGDYRILPRSDADINLIESGCPTSVPDDITADRSRVWLASPKPNPFAPRTTLRFNLPERGRVDLAIYGVDGRLVRKLVPDSTMEAGVYNLIWDGRNNKGEKMPSGLYLVRLTTPLEERSGKLMLIR